MVYPLDRQKDSWITLLANVANHLMHCMLSTCLYPVIHTTVLIFMWYTGFPNQNMSNNWWVSTVTCLIQQTSKTSLFPKAAPFHGTFQKELCAAPMQPPSQRAFFATPCKFHLRRLLHNSFQAPLREGPCKPMWKGVTCKPIIEGVVYNTMQCHLIGNWIHL